PRERSEPASALDAPEVPAELLRALDVPGPFRPMRQLVAIREDREERRHERARARQAGGPGQVAREGDVGAPHAGAIERGARRDRPDENGPARTGGLERGVERDLGREASPPVEDPEDGVFAGPRRDAESPARGAQEAAAAGVIGVLAEDLDAARDEEPAHL